MLAADESAPSEPTRSACADQPTQVGFVTFAAATSEDGVAGVLIQTLKVFKAINQLIWHGTFSDKIDVFQGNL